MTDIHIRTDSRTKEESILDIKFGVCYNDLNVRLYRRLDLLFGFVGLFGGSGALIAAIGAYKELGVVAGAAVAGVAVIERLIGSVEKAVRHEEVKRKYSALLIKSDGLDFAEVERRLQKLQCNSPSGFHSLLAPAYNKNVRANGRPDYMLKLSTWERVVAFFA